MSLISINQAGNFVCRTNNPFTTPPIQAQNKRDLHYYKRLFERNRLILTSPNFGLELMCGNGLRFGCGDGCGAGLGRVLTLYSRDGYKWLHQQRYRCRSRQTKD